MEDIIIWDIKNRKYKARVNAGVEPHKAAQKWAVLLFKKGCEQVFKNHILFKCKKCGCEFTIPKEWIKATTNWVGCPLHGKHNATVGIGAYDSLCECMQAGEIDLSKL